MSCGGLGPSVSPPTTTKRFPVIETTSATRFCLQSVCSTKLRNSRAEMSRTPTTRAPGANRKPWRSAGAATSFQENLLARMQRERRDPKGRFRSQRQIVNNTNMQRAAELNPFLTKKAVCSLLTYGCEVWNLIETTMTVLNGANSRCV